MANNRFDMLVKSLVPVTLTVALFTGFGNMPIYKRYYISAVPGLGWSGNFYVNLNVHYIAGALLLAMAVYFVTLHLRTRLSSGCLTKTGTLRAAVFGLCLLTGILLATRNLGGVNFTMGIQMAVAFMHLGAAMLVLVLFVGCGIIKKPWTRESQ